MCFYIHLWITVGVEKTSTCALLQSASGLWNWIRCRHSISLHSHSFRFSLKVYASVDCNAYTFHFHIQLIIQWPIKSTFFMLGVVCTVFCFFFVFFFSFFSFFSYFHHFKDLFHMHPNATKPQGFVVVVLLNISSSSVVMEMTMINIHFFYRS